MVPHSSLCMKKMENLLLSHSQSFSICWKPKGSIVHVQYKKEGMFFFTNNVIKHWGLFVPNSLWGFPDADEVGTAPDDEGGNEEGGCVDGKDEPPIELNGHGVDVIDGGIEGYDVELLL